MSTTPSKPNCIIVEWFKHEVRRVYGDLSLSNEERDSARTIQLIERRGGRIRARDLQRADRRFKTADNAESELQSLVDAGFGSWETIPAGAQGGKPTRDFVLFDQSDPDSADCRQNPRDAENSSGIVNSQQGYTFETTPRFPETLSEPFAAWEELDQAAPFNSS
jgi:hypothetical protein